VHLTAADLRALLLLLHRMLLTAGAWREMADGRGNTACHYAAAKGHLDILVLLLTECMVRPAGGSGAQQRGSGHARGCQGQGRGAFRLCP
jgi:hypothetical protein